MPSQMKIHQRKIYTIWFYSYVESKKNWANEQTTETDHRYREHTGDCQRGESGEIGLIGEGY